MIAASSRPSLPVWLAVAAAVAFHAATIRSGHIWGADFALYLAHAKNLVEGVPYQETGYLYNPASPVESPRSYPPIFPLILAPVVAWRGFDLELMKLVGIAFLAVGLGLVAALFRRELTPGRRVALVLITGFFPTFSKLKNSVLSDIPFFCLLYLGFVLIARYYRDGDHRDRRSPGAGQALLLGACLYLILATRTVGVTLAVALVAWEWLERRRLSRGTGIALAACAALVAVQPLWAPGQGSYADQLRFDRETLLDNLRFYGGFLTPSFDHGYTLIATLFLLPLLTGLAVLGFAARVRQGASVREVFVPLYLAVLYLWPGQAGLRYLVPILPLYVVYSFAGLSRLAGLVGALLRPGLGRSIERVAFAVVLAGTLASYAARYSGMDYGPIRDGVDEPEALALYRFLASHTPPAAVVLGNKPTILSLYTGRRTSLYRFGSDDAELWEYIGRIGASYVVVGRFDGEDLRGFVRRHPERLEEMFHDGAFRVFRIRPAPA